MSTKIFEGRRFPKTQLTAFVNEVRPAQYKIILEQARHLAALSDPKKLKRDTWDCRVMNLTDLFRKLAKQHERCPPFDLECGWRIWLPPRGRFAYASPWGEHYTRLDLTLPDYVEDYAYWDNTDPPEGMRDGAGYRRWRRRSKDWECATEPCGELNCVRLTVFEADGLCSASLYVDLQRLGMPSVVDRLARLAR